MKTERKTVILLVSIAKEKDTWQNIAENPESVLKDSGYSRRETVVVIIREKGFDHRKAADRRSSLLNRLHWAGKSRIFEVEGKHQ
jgi:flavin reductase (DIM6/NTAB) family NADH-FMN oxidoreductase RutF